MYMSNEDELSSAWNFGPNMHQEQTVESVTEILLDMYNKRDLYSKISSASLFKESKLPGIFTVSQNSFLISSTKSRA